MLSAVRVSAATQRNHSERTETTPPTTTWVLAHRRLLSSCISPTISPANHSPRSPPHLSLPSDTPLTKQKRPDDSRHDLPGLIVYNVFSILERLEALRSGSARVILPSDNMGPISVPRPVCQSSSPRGKESETASPAVQFPTAGAAGAASAAGAGARRVAPSGVRDVASSQSKPEPESEFKSESDSHHIPKPYTRA